MQSYFMGVRGVNIYWYNILGMQPDILWCRLQSVVMNIRSAAHGVKDWQR